MATLKQPAKVLRVLGPKDDAAWERALVGIYDALDGLTSAGYVNSGAITNINVTPKALAPAAPMIIMLGDGGDGGSNSNDFPLKGDQGLAGATGASVTGPPGFGADSPDVDAMPIIPPSPAGSRMLGIMKWSAHYAESSTATLFCNDWGGVGGVAGSGNPSTASTVGWFYGIPTPVVLNNLRVTFTVYGGLVSMTVTIYKNGTPTTMSLTETGAGAFIDSAHPQIFLGSQLVDCSVQGIGPGDGIAAEFDISATVEIWSVPGSGM